MLLKFFPSFDFVRYHVGEVFGSTSCESLPEADMIFLSRIYFIVSDQ